MKLPNSLWILSYILQSAWRPLTCKWFQQTSRFLSADTFTAPRSLFFQRSNTHSPPWWTMQSWPSYNPLTEACLAPKPSTYHFTSSFTLQCSLYVKYACVSKSKIWLKMAPQSQPLSLLASSTLFTAGFYLNWILILGLLAGMRLQRVNTFLLPHAQLCYYQNLQHVPHICNFFYTGKIF